jgi:2-C-methyl-D-erythritol 4-phosphate cytidylyltransferase
VGVPVKDTIKQITNAECRMPNEGYIITTLDRSRLWQAQTPQVFRTALIKKAYVQLKGRVTDDAMAVEKIGKPVKIVTGSYHNLKVTTTDDLLLADKLLKKRTGR